MVDKRARRNRKSYLAGLKIVEKWLKKFVEKMEMKNMKNKLLGIFLFTMTGGGHQL